MSYLNDWWKIFFGGMEYPYTDSCKYNDDWLLDVVKKLVEEFANFVNLNKIKYADPIGWNITRQYESNTVVVDNRTGSAYISTKPVPAGVQINNTNYWTQIYNYADVVDTLRSQICYNAGDSTTAPRAFAVGDLVFSMGLLYRVISPMIAGDRFVVNSNVTKTTVEAEIKRILTSVATEAAARAEADTLLQANINAEVGAREATDSQLRTNLNSTNQTLNNEITNREAADNYLHGLINTETNNRVAADDYLHRLLNPNGRVYMFVGDSYAEAHYAWESDVIGWCDYCQDYLNLSDDQYLANFAGATGFCTANKWYDMINNYVVPEGVEVTDIVIGGGYNDKDYSVNTITAAIATCANMIRTKFPMARVWLCFMGWDCRDAQWQGLMQAKSAYIQGAGANGWNYIPNVDWLAHNYTDGAFYTTTGDTPFGSNFHPNNNGEKSIARAISTVLKGGQFEDFKVLESCDLTAVSDGTSSFTPSYEQLYTSCVNGVVDIFSKHDIEVNISPTTNIVADGSLIPIGEFTSGLLHGDANEQTIANSYIVLQNTDDTNLALFPCMIVLKQNRLFAKIYEIRSNAWNTRYRIFRFTIRPFEAIGIGRTRI